MNFEKHFLQHELSGGKKNKSGHKSVFSSIEPAPSAPPSKAVPPPPPPDKNISARQPIPVPMVESKFDMAALDDKFDAMEKNISERLEAALKSFQPIKSENGEALVLSKLSELENRVMDFQKKTLLSLIQKRDEKFIEIIKKERLAAAKVQAVKEEEFIEIIKKERLVAAKTQALKDSLIEEKTKKLLNDKMNGIAKISQDSIKKISAAFTRSLETFYGKMDGTFFTMFESVEDKLCGSIISMKEQLSNDRKKEFKTLLPEIKTDLKLAITNCFSGERDLFTKEMEEFSLRFEEECKKLVEIQKNASNNMSKIKTDLQSGIKRNFSEEGVVFRKEMEEFSFRFAEEYKRLNEMQKAALSNTADIKNDLQSAIKRNFSEERELFEKEMEEVSLKLAEEHKNMNEIQNAALDTAFEVKTDLQCAIKKHFNDERDLFRKEMEDVSFKFAGEYKKLDKILNRLNNMNIVDDKIQAFLKRMEVVIAEGENSLLNRASMENKKLLLKMKEFCASTSREMFSVEAISHYLNEFHGKASGIGKNLEQLVNEIDTLRFEPILGAAGIAIKREFEFLRNGLLELRNETESFNNLKDKIEQVVGNLPKKDEKK